MFRFLFFKYFRCFENISPEARINAVKELILADLRFHLDTPPISSKGDQACHYIIKNETKDGHAGFHYECCGKSVCTDEHDQEWLEFLMILIGEFYLFYFLNF